MSDPRTNAAEIELIGHDRLVVHWEDGHTSTFDTGFLRVKCPCAVCAGEEPPIQLKKEEPKIEVGMSLPVLPAKARPVHPASVEPVGYYAIRIVWSDGHDAGIYSFRLLRSLCPCGNCGEQR